MDYLHNNNVNVLQNESRHLFLVTATEVVFFCKGAETRRRKGHEISLPLISFSAWPDLSY